MQCKKGFEDMKATGIVRRIDDLGRVVIPKEIRRTLRIREGDPSLKTLKPLERFCLALMEIGQRVEPRTLQFIKSDSITSVFPGEKPSIYT